MNRRIGIGLLILTVGMLMTVTPYLAEFSQSGFHIYSPSQDNQSYKDGQTVILDFSSDYKSNPFTIIVNRYCYNSTTGTTSINLYNEIGAITNSSGGFYSPIISGQYPIGKYQILLEDAYSNAYAEFNLTITPDSYPAYLAVTVQSQNGTIIPGATVEAKAPNGTIVAMNKTSNNGVAYLQVQYPLSPINYTVIAYASGFATESKVVTVNSNATFPVTLSLPYSGLHIYLVKVFGVNESSMTFLEGKPITLEYQVEYQGMPESNVIVYLYLQGGTSVLNKTTNTTNANGLTNFTVVPKYTGKPYEILTNATVIYNNQVAFKVTQLKVVPNTRVTLVPINVKVSETNGTPLFSNVTLKYPNGTTLTARGSSVTFNVTYNGTPEHLTIYASSLGFMQRNQTIYVNSTLPINVTLALPKEFMNVSIELEQDGKILTSPYTVKGGIPVYVNITASMNSMPVPATVTEEVKLANGTTASYNITLPSNGSTIEELTLPKTNGTNQIYLKISYNGVTYTHSLTITSQVPPVSTLNTSTKTPTSTPPSTPPSTATSKPSDILYIIIGIIAVVAIVGFVILFKRSKQTQ
jgi:hypothetical protein